MRKFMLAMGIVSVLGIYGCNKTTSNITTPSVQYAAEQPDGAKLSLTWTAISNIDGYHVYIYYKSRDTTIDLSSSATTYEVTTPAKTIEVSAYKGTDESDKWTLDLTAVKTTTITVYGANDPVATDPSGFGFSTTDGSVHTYALSGVDTATNWPLIDFYLEDRGAISLSLYAPTDVPSSAFPYHKLNDKGNVSVAASVSDFDTFNITSAPGGSYSTQTLLSNNTVYSFWLDPNNNSWDATEDHFGKLKVTTISGERVDMEVAYQKVPGLRWVVTE